MWRHHCVYYLNLCANLQQTLLVYCTCLIFWCFYKFLGNTELNLRLLLFRNYLLFRIITRYNNNRIGYIFVFDIIVIRSFQKKKKIIVPVFFFFYPSLFTLFIFSVCRTITNEKIKGQHFILFGGVIFVFELISN